MWFSMSAKLMTVPGGWQRAGRDLQEAVAAPVDVLVCDSVTFSLVQNLA